MARSGEIRLEFGGEERAFRLTPVRWEAVQEACDAGPPELAQRLAMGAALLPAEVREKMPYLQQAAQGLLGSWRRRDIREPIVQGLIGAGMEPNAAGRLWREYGDERPLIENVPLALAIVMASIVGAPDEPLGEQTGEAATPSSPAESSASPPSTEPPRPSGSDGSTSTT